MMLRVLLTCFGDKASMSWSSGWPPILAWIAVITMTVANLVAGQQESVKRMLAYSSIAHAGYLLVGVVATMHSQPQGASSVLFYLLTYTVSTAGAFGALILCGSRGAEAVTYEDLAGIGRRHPPAALAFSLFLVSLAGCRRPPASSASGSSSAPRSTRGFYTLDGHRVPEQRHRRLLLPARHGVHVHARARGGRAHRDADALRLRDGGAAPRPPSSSSSLGIMPGQSLDMAIKAASIFGG